jgi:PAS domain-containing protein
MEYTFNEKMSKPSLHSCDGLIIEVNQEFVDFSGFTKEELLGKSLLDLNTMLRINLQLNLDNSNSHIGYIFTKSLEAREVNIICVHNDKNSMKVYTFIEQQNSRLENKLIFVEQTFIENILGAAVYSAPDLVLLKANQCYLSFMDSPHNKDKKCIGKPFREIVKESPESEIESFLNAILETQKTSHIKEYKINKKASGTTYWDATLTPIFESGKMKYIFVTSVDVTDRVLNKQFMEQQNYTIKKQIKDLETQNKELEAIINNICEEIYIIDKNGNYIITNEAVNKRNSYGNLKQKYDAFNKFDYYDLSGNKLRKKDLPITKLMNGESLINNIMIGYDPHKRFICTNTKPILDVNGNFVMGIMCSRDITNDILYKQSIERHLDMFSNLINNLDLPVIRLSYPDLTIKDINQKKFTILKSLKPEIKSPNDIIGKNYMYIIEGTTYSNAIMNCLNSGIKEKKTSYMKGMKWIVYGQEMFMTTLFQPILGSDGEIEEIIAVSFDVTSEVRINNQMERTLKKQDEFFANISHELKTPLNVIFTTAQLLNMYCNSGSLD